MRPVAWSGQIVTFAPRPPRNGELGMVELRDGRRFFKRVWAQEGQVLLESINPAEPEEPIVMRPGQVRRQWRWLATINPE